MQKLKTEFLRIALLSSILFVVSIFAFKAWVSEQKHMRMLSINYTSTGIQYASSGNPQEALLYFTEALKANPRESSTAASVSLLLQETIWPILTRKEEGFLQYGQPLPLSVYAYDTDSQTSLSIA